MKSRLACPSWGAGVLLALVVSANLNSLLAQWVQTNGPNGSYGGSVQCFAVSGSNLFAGTWGDGVFLSTNNGTDWTAVNTGLTNLRVYALAFSDSNLFAGTFGGAVFLSTNNGTSWTAVNTGLTNPDVYALAVLDSNLFAGTNGGVFLSTNNGASWTAANTGLTSDTVMSLAVSGNNLFAGVYGDGVFLSTNSGTSWTAAKTGLVTQGVYFWSFAVLDTNLFAGTTFGVFLSTNNGASWTAAKPDIVCRCLTVFDNNLFAGPLSDNDVFLSTNNGTSWTSVGTGLTQSDVFALAVLGTNLFAGTSSGVRRRPLSEMVTSVERLSSQLPAHFTLSQNFPNPFNPTTVISFGIPSLSFVTLKVFDASGREVRVLVSEELPPGSYARQWNAVSFPSGAYFYRLQAGSFTQTRTLILLK